MVRYGRQYRLLSRGSASQSNAADGVMIKVDLAAHQAMQPFRAHGKALAEQIDVAGLIGAANEDDVPAQRRMRVKREVLGHRSAPRGRFGKHLRSRAVRCDVSVRARL